MSEIKKRLVAVRDRFLAERWQIELALAKAEGRLEGFEACLAMCRDAEQTDMPPHKALPARHYKVDWDT